ncbi:MAG: tetratricopeptide repeat protein [Blastocatellia bacterium]|nr:tetratricopeptide repeat protein [Blastocatellia bacterium]
MKKIHIWQMILSLLLLAPSAGAQEATPEITSQLGTKYYANKDEKGDVAAAEQKLAADPKNIESIIALGRAQAGIWRYHDAIATYTRGIELAPRNPMLHRLRGHRYLSVRQFDKALADMKQAAKLNGAGGKDADLDFDIWYHLALSHYLKGDFSSAAAAYERCREVSKTDDKLIAVSDWLYMTYRRMKKDAEAAKVLERITPQMQVRENKSYFDRLLLYKGLKKEADLVNLEKASDLDIATVGYGLGNWHLYNGNRDRANEYFRKIVSGKYWPAFGFIAAETELARRK